MKIITLKTIAVMHARIRRSKVSLSLYGSSLNIFRIKTLLRDTYFIIMLIEYQDQIVTHYSGSLKSVISKLITK